MAAVIDLGDDWEPAEPGARVPAPKLLRACLALLALAGVLLGTARSAEPGPAPLTELAVLPDQARLVLLAQGALITASADRLHVYELDGTPRWSAPGLGGDAPEVTGRWVIAQTRGFFLSARNSVSGDRRSVVTVPSLSIFDLATGEPRIRAAMQATRHGDRTLVLDPVVAGPGIEFREHETLALRWSLPRPYAYLVDDARQLVFSVTAEGLLAERDLITGAVRRTLPLAARPVGERGTLTVRDGRVELVPAGMLSWIGEEGTSDVWLEQMPQVVHTTAPDPDEPGSCGDRWCVRRDEHGDRVVADLATGERWPLPYGRHLLDTPAGPLMIAYGDRPRSGELTGSVDPTLVQAIGVVERRTGRIVRPLGGWLVVPETAPTSQDQVSRGRVLLRPDPAGGRTHVGALTPGGARPLGALPFLPFSCTARDDLLVCVDIRTRTHVVKVTP